MTIGINKFLRNKLPGPEIITENRYLRFLSPWLGHPRLWHMHRRSVALGIAGVVMVFVLWTILAGMGVFDQINGIIGQVVQSDGQQAFDIMEEKAKAALKKK